MALDRGILYVAIGRKYFDEAVLSAESAKREMPSIPIKMCTDIAEYPACFDEVQIIEPADSQSYDKVVHVPQSPFERTLALDTDTYIAAPVEELFDLLDRFDFAATLSPARRSDRWVASRNWQAPGLPDCFSEFNCGVLVFRRGPIMAEIFRDWDRFYEEDQERLQQRVVPNQPSFCRAVYESNARYCVLPTEYNCRFTFPVALAREVKILHGREHAGRLDLVAELLNQSREIRAFIPTEGKLYY